MANPIDVREIMHELRAKIRNRSEPQKPFGTELAEGSSTGVQQLKEGARALEAAASHVGIAPPEPPTARGHIGALLVRAVQRALFWYTPQVVQFQLAVSRITNDIVSTLARLADLGQRHSRAVEALNQQIVELSAGMERLHEKVREVCAQNENFLKTENMLNTELARERQARSAAEARLVNFAKKFESLREKLDGDVGACTEALKATNDRLDSEISSASSRSQSTEAKIRETETHFIRLRTELISQNRRLAILLEEARKRLPQPFDEKQLLELASEENHELDAFYVGFEDQFRGTRLEIKERLRVYLPYLRQRKLGTKLMPIIDLGCGRGEWLTLLSENDFQARGVDVNRVLVAQCKAMGLDVVEDDLLHYLRSMSDASVGAVTGFHVIEHLPIGILLKALDETARVLQPGGIAIFETPNPQNVLVGSHNFYLDFTHRKPIPAPTAQFLLEARGLCDVQILNLHPYPDSLRLLEEGSEVTKRFNEYFYGPQDYAVIGHRAFE